MALSGRCCRRWLSKANSEYVLKTGKEKGMNTQMPQRAPQSPGRRPGPDQRDELLRIWGAVDHDGRKMLLYFARALARDQGLVPAATPLVITDHAF